MEKRLEKAVESDSQEFVTISTKEYITLKRKALLNEKLLLKLVKNLEDIRKGKIKRGKKN